MGTASPILPFVDLAEVAAHRVLAQHLAHAKQQRVHPIAAQCRDVGVAPMTRQNRQQHGASRSRWRGAFGLLSDKGQSATQPSNNPPCFRYSMKNGSWPNGTSSGEGTASGVGTATFTADVVFTGGTGLFAGATGGATGLQMLMTTGPTTVSGSGTYVGTLSLVPEPSSLALLAPAAFFVFYRRRRRAIAGLPRQRTRC